MSSQPVLSKVIIESAFLQESVYKIAIIPSFNLEAKEHAGHRRAIATGIATKLGCTVFVPPASALISGTVASWRSLGGTFDSVAPLCTTALFGGLTQQLSGCKMRTDRFRRITTQLPCEK